MKEIPKIVIAPHKPQYVGDLGITQFAEDLSRTMLSTSSWDRHWPRKGTVTDLHTGDIMIFAFKDDNEWYAIGDAVLLYNGIEEDCSDCKRKAGGEWNCCYHFTDFRLYSKYISYNQMKRELSLFNEDTHKVVHIGPEDYVRLLSLTATR
ncbi:MAG: hypothetical protein M1477_00935 [Candidatus Thermoplasmatota archaeon]|nr:hypothetical protein [Candidatus Thermoplasmatota archaeon]MCL5988779.1 hypothetical protein [Candidatus Thermoplasmatota archaeon]